MIDSHCHLEQEVYDKDRDEVVERARANGLKAIVFSLSSPKHLEKAIKIVERYKGYVFATLGFHPELIGDFPLQVIEEYLNSIARHRDSIVGIGETGLDYHWVKDEKLRKLQRDLLIKHLELAKRLDLPVVIHSRDATEDTFDILESFGYKRIHWHMFGYHDQLKRAMDNGWYISVNAILFRSKRYRKIARDAPIDRLMVETDAPWLLVIREGRNEPSTIVDIARMIASIRKTDFEEIWLQLGLNAKKFYNLPVEL